MSPKQQWPPIESETLHWDRDLDDLEYVPRSAKRRIRSTYEASVPLEIATRDITVTTPLAVRIADMLVSLTRFDEAQRARGYALPALLLRSESSSSSQIEHLTSSARNVALAEVVADAPHNARLISANVRAMRAAIELPDELDVSGILKVHEALLGGLDSSAGKLREEQVWIGGTPYSPHGAEFVPPSAPRVRPLLDDLVTFSRRDDLDPITKAAILHAQFETIHPFVDGNGRCGRALLQKSLRRDGVLRNTSLPISAGLLHDVNGYMGSLDAYHKGDPLAPVITLLDSLDVALALGSGMAQSVDEVLSSWRGSLTARKGSAIWELPNLLVEHPVVTSGLVAERLGITERAARNLLEVATESGIVTCRGNARRGRFYQADEILEILDEASRGDAVRRASPFHRG